MKIIKIASTGRFLSASVILLFLFIPFLFSQEQRPLSENLFVTPPESAKPRTWWHWTNSNITREGITKDLEWMKRAGIGGFQLADVASGSGQTVDKKLLFMSPEWLDAVKHAASEADRLGLEMTVFSSAGWSLTGGPWVKPGEAMKKLVWSDTVVTGPIKFNAELPSPPGLEGPILNMSRSGRVTPNDPKFYRDNVILAFPVPGEKSKARLVSTVSSSGPVDPRNLTDNDLNTTLNIKQGTTKGIVWIEYSYDQPLTAGSATLASRTGIPFGKLLAGMDGKNYETVVLFPGPQLYRAGKVQTLSFNPVIAKYFRFEFTGAPAKPAEVMSESITKPDSVYSFTELRLNSESMVNRWEDKAGFFHLFNYDPVETGLTDKCQPVMSGTVLNLTSKTDSTGRLTWTFPAGQWRIMRFGYSLTGSKNRPAVASGLGYEVDKLSREHSLAYIKNYTDPLITSLGSLYGKSLKYVLLDSWEAGMQNWTEKMPEEFLKRRGYDLIPYLPCLSGQIIDSREVSDRVLWDFRRTLADMFAENHFGAITDYLHSQGLKTYGEVSGVSLEILEDALLCKKQVDIPMGEFWYRALHPELMYYQDVRGAASAAHIYGKNIVGAESFTGGGYESPGTLKKIGDYWFTQGINRIIFHTSAHQPLDTKPGNTMVGTHINRNITWAEQAAPFMTYLSRVSGMLQQGLFVADLLYLLDEGAPSTMPVWGPGLIPQPPEGYDYDYINTDALLTRVNVSSDGKLVMPDGMKYSLLVLPHTTKMTLPVLEKIAELIKAGAVVLGPKPLRTPGLTGYPESEKILGRITGEIWGDLDGVSRTIRQAGKGKILWNIPVKAALEIAGVKEDFEYDKKLDSHLDWIHRQCEDADIYFVVNSSGSDLSTSIRLRAGRSFAEIWSPVSGKIFSKEFKLQGERTVLNISLTPGESEFIVLKNTQSSMAERIPEYKYVTEYLPSGSWEITFPAGSGAPEKVNTDTLRSLTMFATDGIKYFSGTATYRKKFTISGDFLKGGKKFVLDLGKVGDMASVSVNGSEKEILWLPPFTSDITGYLRKGENELVIEVTNQWTNRIAGDMKLPAGKKVLSSPGFVRPGSLSESGLSGPVRIIKYYGYLE